jgi:RNase_H superfamily
MLCFDIETTGLNAHHDRVTCVCMYDQDTDLRQAYVFDHPPTSQDTLSKRDEVMGLLDHAGRLCAFNGARFDLPFIARSWGADDARLGGWLAKLVDVFEACKLALNKTFSLNLLLAANGLEGKSGSGLEAVRLAQQGEWDALSDYCMQDVLLTHQVTSLDEVVLPRTHIRWSIRGGFV